MNSQIKDSLDRPLRDLRISVIDRCNFRCQYCMPAEIFHENFQFLPKSELLSYEEIVRLSKIFASLGVKTKVDRRGTITPERSHHSDFKSR